MVKMVKFRIDAKGEVHVEVDGVVGTGCEDLTKDFEELLGAVVKREHKDAYYHQDQETMNKDFEYGEL